MVYISGGNELLDPRKIFERLGLKPGNIVGDLGCGGAGHFTIPAGQIIGSQGLVYAVDVLKSVLYSVAGRARIEGVNNVKTLWSNLEVPNATRIPDKTLDFALLINMLFQSKDRESIIREAVRMMKDRAELLVIDWNVSGGAIGPIKVDRVDPEEIKSIAKNIGLQLIDEFQAGNHHYGLIFKKK